MDKEKVPNINERYFFFDDGKISYSRMYQAIVTKVFPYKDAPDFLKKYFKKESLNADWIFDGNTDYFIGCEIKDYDKDTIWFARAKNGGWFSMDIQNDWQGGRLDVSGKLEDYLINMYG